MRTPRRPPPILVPLFVVGLVGCGQGERAPELDLGPPRQLVYVASGSDEKHGGAEGAGAIHVYDRSTLEPVADFAVSGGAGEVHATPDGRVVWIVNPGGNSISLLETDTYDLVRVRVGVGPTHGFISPDHREIWVSNDVSSDVTVVDVATSSVVATLLTGAGHHKLAFAVDDAGDRTFAYVSNLVDSSITPIDADLAILPNVTGVGAFPHGIDYSDVTHHVYNCSGDDENSVEVIATRDDPATAENEAHTVVDRIALPVRCDLLQVSEDGGFAHAALPDAELFARIRLSDLALETYDVDPAPAAFVVLGTTAYVASGAAPALTRVDLTGGTPPTSIPIGNAAAAGAEAGPRSIVVDGALLFVTNAADDSVSVVDVAAGSVVATWNDIPRPRGIAVAGPEGGTTYPR